MENYIKAVLYGYPMLTTIGTEYAEHIRNRAILSYRSSRSAEELAEYLAEEILRKNRLERLKTTVESVLSRLSERELALIEMRYFGKRKRAASLFVFGKNGLPKGYFRMQRRLGEKVDGMLRAAGVTEKRFLEEYAPLEEFRRIWRFVLRNSEREQAAAQGRKRAEGERGENREMQGVGMR